MCRGKKVNVRIDVTLAHIFLLYYICCVYVQLVSGVN